MDDDFLKDHMLLPHSWENEHRLVVLARDMDPMSPKRGHLVYAGAKASFDALDPVLSNMGRAHRTPEPYTFERDQLVGWYVDDTTSGFNRNQLDALKAATDWEQAWAQFLGQEEKVTTEGIDQQPERLTADFSRYADAGPSVKAGDYVIFEGENFAYQATNVVLGLDGVTWFGMRSEPLPDPGMLWRPMGWRRILAVLPEARQQ